MGTGEPEGGGHRGAVVAMEERSEGWGAAGDAIAGGRGWGMTENGRDIVEGCTD